MGRERQKRKNRSGLSRVRQKAKSKKTVLSNPIIAANWDKTKTLSQNYKRLGLAAKLNKQTGGVEKDLSKLYAGRQDDPDMIDTQDSLKITSASGLKAYGLSEAKVERDPKTGRIVRVIQDSNLMRSNPLHDPLNDLDSDLDEDDFTGFALDNQHGNIEHLTAGSSTRLAPTPSTSVVPQLEERARLPAAKHKRRQTENEQAFIRSLVGKYGSDYGSMARDIKINYMQRSEGDLKGRIKIWKDNGGTTE